MSAEAAESLGPVPVTADLAFGPATFLTPGDTIALFERAAFRKEGLLFVVL